MNELIQKEKNLNDIVNQNKENHGNEVQEYKKLISNMKSEKNALISSFEEKKKLMSTSILSLKQQLKELRTTLTNVNRFINKSTTEFISKESQYKTEVSSRFKDLQLNFRNVQEKNKNLTKQIELKNNDVNTLTLKLDKKKQLLKSYKKQENDFSKTVAENDQLNNDVKRLTETANQNLTNFTSVQKKYKKLQQESQNKFKEYYDKITEMTQQ